MSQRQHTTQAIVLARTDYGEADRIITVLTPHAGKLRLIAKGVRKVKSKLAGGIELFSISTITYIVGRKEIGTLVSARLETHFGNIVSDIHRTMFAYDVLKQLHKATEDEPEPAYFAVLAQCLWGLDTLHIPMDVVRLWFMTQLIRLSGHVPNLHTTAQGDKLRPDAHFVFDPDVPGFAERDDGQYSAAHIKLLRLAFSDYSLQRFVQVQQVSELSAQTMPVVRALYGTYIHAV